MPNGWDQVLRPFFFCHSFVFHIHISGRPINRSTNFDIIDMHSGDQVKKKKKFANLCPFKMMLNVVKSTTTIF